MNSMILMRMYSSKASMKKSANTIRKEFLDYFRKDLGHSFIRSSPTAPLSDQTIPFVNAGMNQFKGIFLDHYDPPATKVVNTQKCIRVGGKHNDLNVVGNDSYHHTFFEMLGNWSFGDYFKEEACTYAWDLLTKHYGIKKEFLYVTYFAGDEKLGLQPDLECKDIWLRIGVPKDRILAFGAADNFWEMGLSGPCGSCTEIHVDHTKQFGNRAAHVNKGLSNLTELWNIVFIQYERMKDGTIVPLKKQHIDTGMGFERLVAFLQETSSNYDTDLFMPLFKSIQNYSKAPEYKGRFNEDDKYSIDTGYRILADHARMVTVAISDGILPDDNQKLRRVIRKAVDVSENVFKSNGILSELSYSVAEILSDAYPELHANLKQVREILEYEEELYKRLRKASGANWMKMVKSRPELARISDYAAPGLVAGYKDLQSMMGELRENQTIPGSVALKLYDTYGLNAETIAELAEVESLHFDEISFQNELENHRFQTKLGLKGTAFITRDSVELLGESNVPKTDDSFKYQYTFDGNCYEFPTVQSKIIALLVNGEVIVNEGKGSNTELKVGDNVGIILDRTPCYASEGGQRSDEGDLHTDTAVFNINTVKKINGYVIHFGQLAKDANLEIGMDCQVSINPEKRFGAMRHHTGTHLLNASLKKNLSGAYQYGSVVAEDALVFRFKTFGDKLSFEQLKNIENLINESIKSNAGVTTRTLNSLELLAEDSVTLVPSEIYSHTGIRVVEIHTDSLTSKEACCGTHVHNTGILENFCILNHIRQGAVKNTIKAVLGPKATFIIESGKNMETMISNLEKELKEGKYDYETAEKMLDDVKNDTNNKGEEVSIPYLLKHEYLQRLETLSKEMWKQLKDQEKNHICAEVENTAHRSLPFIVHLLEKEPAHLSLHEVVSLFPTKPVLIVSQNNGAVKARCYVPEKMACDNFNAPAWMNTVIRVFYGRNGPVEGFNPFLVSCMRSKVIAKDLSDSTIKKAIEEARNYASLHVKQPKRGLLQVLSES